MRTAITIGAGEQGRWLAYFGDQRATAMQSMPRLVHRLEAIGQISRRDHHRCTDSGRRNAPSTSSAEEVLGANSEYECCKFREHLRVNAATGRGALEELHHPG